MPGVRATRVGGRLRADPVVAGLIFLVAVAAALRFATIAHESYWFDEAHTVRLALAPFGAHALGIDNQAEPPLYFALAWVWARVFGYSEAGLRSLSALAGVLTVPVAYSAARSLASRRAALIAAAIVATSPVLIAYSQEARSYALYVLLGALSFMFVARIREDPSARNHACWAVASALAVASHYFAVFLVVPEAVWVLLRSADRRRAKIAVGGLAAALLALAPLALHERVHGATDWIANSSLRLRLDDATRTLVVGRAPGDAAMRAIQLAGLALVVVAVARADRRARGGARLALGASAVVVALAAAAGLLGADYVLDRNLLAAVVPMAVVVAVGLAVPARRRVTVALAVVLCAGLVAEHVRVARDPALQRDDWRSVAAAIGPARPDRVVSVVPGWQEFPLGLYRPGLRLMTAPASVREVVAITYRGLRPRPGPRTQPAPPPPFRRTRERRIQRMTVTWFRAPRPVRLHPTKDPLGPAIEGPVRFLSASRRGSGQRAAQRRRAL